MYKSEWVKASANLLLKKSLIESQMELQKYYRRAIVNNTYDLKSMQDSIQASLHHCSSTDQRSYRGAVLINENESDQRESINNPKHQSSFIVQTK